MSHLYDCLTDRFVSEVFIKNIYPQSKGVVFDIGALNGEYALYTYNTASKIICVEANPEIADLLSQKVREFGLDKIKVYKAALSTVTGTVGFDFNRPYGGWSVSDAAQATIVPSVSLSQLIEENGVEMIDLLKIDIEGYERVIFSDPDFPVSKIKAICGEHCPSEVLESLGFSLVNQHSGWYINKEYGNSLGN